MTTYPESLFTPVEVWREACLLAANQRAALADRLDAPDTNLLTLEGHLEASESRSKT